MLTNLAYISSLCIYYYSDAPPAKRQKMSSYGSSHTALKQQDSFTEVLAQLEADAESAEYAQGGGVEGEADGERKIGHIETSAAWPRPALGKWDAQSDKIGKHGSSFRSIACVWLNSVPRSTAVFQQIDIDESTDATTGSTLRLFGLTKKGNSILLHVHGFKPYFYVAAPKDFMTEDCKHLRDQLNVSRAKFRKETTTRKRWPIKLNNRFSTGLGDSRQPGSRDQRQHLYAEVVMGISRQSERAFHQDHMRRPEVHPEGER
jgi:hypothetical protein